MQTELLVAILAGLGGMLGWGFADFFAKKTIDQIGDIASLAWGHVFGTLTLLTMVFYQMEVRGKEIALPENPQTWIFMIIFGVMQALIYFLVYKGFGKGQVGLLSPVFAAFSGITAVLSIVFFGEIIGGYLLVGLVTIFIGILLVNIDIKAFFSRRLRFTRIPGFKEVAFATLMAGLWTLSWDVFIGGADWLSYTFFMYSFMTFAILVASAVQRVDLFAVKSSIWKFLILIGVCETFAYLAISLGYSATPRTSVVALLSGAFSLPTIILARMFLKEKITLIQTVGSLIIIVGIMMLSVL
ncbi:MAG: DMT family transporter [Candidatus Andersenbacteria bacterium]|nr:DMT family transporter [Candidatus Andersenbacteria bacterium]